MRLRRTGKLKEATKAMIEELDTEIEKEEKYLDKIKAERAMLQKKLDEEY